MVSSKDINEINSLIVAQLTAEKNKIGIPIAKIDRDYREETGERIPYAKLGFSKLHEYLRTVSGVEVITMYNAHYVNFTGAEDSRHIGDLVAKQRPKSSRPHRRYSGYSKSSSSNGQRSYRYSTKPNKNITDNIISILKRYSNGLTRTELLQQLNNEYVVDVNINSLNDYLQLLGTQITIKDELIFENSRKKFDDRRNFRCYYDRMDSSRTQTFDINFQSTYNNYRPYSNYVSDDLDFHNGSFDLDSDQIGTENDLIYEIEASNCTEYYNNTFEDQYCTNSPDMTSSQSQQNATHESMINIENSENITDTNTNQRDYIFSQSKDYVSTALSKRVKFRLEKLIQNHPQGIWCTELPKLYEDEYKIPLEWTNLGFQRLSDFVAHLPDIFHTVGPESNGDFKIYNAKEPLPDEKPTTKSKKLTSASLFDVYGDTEVEPVPTSVPASFSKQLCPDDVITIQESVGQVSVTDLTISNYVDKHENPMVEIEVVDAFSPSFFWVRLLKNINKFNKMMKKLGEYYNANYEKYAVPIIMLERGLNVACVFYGKWHRAIIKSVDPSCRVTVLFYDYGTVNKYPANEIFYLHRSFSALPAQAVPCGLYGVAPHEGDKWPKRVRDWFIQWVYEKSLWANIIEVDPEKNSMLVTLTDTSGKDDFFINDWLIDKNMAEVKKTVCIDPEDMNLYVDDFCEYYTEENGVIEAIIPTTRRPESNGGMNLSISKSSKILSSLSNKLELYKYDWAAFKSQIRQKVDESVMLTMRLYRDFAKNNMGSAAHGIIQSCVGESLTEAILKITFSVIDLDPETIFTEVTNTSNTSPEKSKQAEVTSESTEKSQSDLLNQTESSLLDINNSFDKNLSIIDVPNPVSSSVDMETKRRILENSIKKAATKFFDKRNAVDSNDVMDEKANPFMDTNPFRRNLFTKDLLDNNRTEPPPLPPRSLDIASEDKCLKYNSVNHQEHSPKIVYEAPPLMYSWRLDHSQKLSEKDCRNHKDSPEVELSNDLINIQKFREYLLSDCDIEHSLAMNSANPFKF